MSDRIVYVCGCGIQGGSVFDDGPWEDRHVGRVCESCHQPVTAINIDELLRTQFQMRHFIAEVHDVARSDSFTDRNNWADRAAVLLDEAGDE